MNYLEWNDLIAKYFFNDEMAGREVLLYVDDSMIQELAESQAGAIDDFITALKTGPDWVSRTGFCQKAHQAYADWRDKGLDYPPYIGYLAFFVLAAGVQGDFAPHAYYPRVWNLLGDPVETGEPPSFSKMIDLWDDLEKWSREDKREELGRFVARIRGSWWKVGLPLSQTLLSGKERKQLPILFDESDVDPADPPSSEIMAKIIAACGRHILERRTLRLLDSKTDDDKLLREALVELILDELVNWDGALPEGTAESQSIQVKTGLKICLGVDLLAGSAKAYLRLKTNRPFPEEGLNFGGGHDQYSWTCSQEHLSWSVPLKIRRGTIDETVNAAQFNWEEGFQLTDQENQWRARLTGSEVRVFTPGIYEGLPDWIESRRLPRNAAFLVACTGKNSERIKQWGSSGCEFFQQWKVAGIPDGWSLFNGKGARKSCDGIDLLSVSSSVRFTLQGGIKTGSGRGNSYLHFAPPTVVLENATGAEEITLNDRALKPEVQGSLTWPIPSHAPVDQPLYIELKADTQNFRKVIRLEEPELPLTFGTPGRKSDGKILSSSDSLPKACGATVLSSKDSGTTACPSALPTHLADRIVFVGARPGEIADWPGELLPSGWQPVWALAKRSKKEWEVHFCGSPDHAQADHRPGDPVKDSAARKRWREVVWSWRMVATPPQLGSLRVLWSRYVNAAKDV